VSRETIEKYGNVRKLNGIKMEQLKEERGMQVMAVESVKEC
jgi:hypothetical protein